MEKFDYTLKSLAPKLGAQPQPQQPMGPTTGGANPHPDQAQAAPAPAAAAEATEVEGAEPVTRPDLIDPVTGTQSKPSSPRRSAASPRNLRHGLLAQSVVLATESAARLDILQYNPQTRSEYTVVEMMDIAKWRHRRDLTIQKTDFDLEIARHQSTAATSNTVAASFAHRTLHHNGHTHATAIRYETTFERQYHQPRRELRLLQKEHATNGRHATSKSVPGWSEWSLTFDNILDETESEAPQT